MRKRQNQKRSAIALIGGLILQLLLSLFVVNTANAADPAPLDLGSPIAIAVDADTGRILYSKEMHRRTPMASTTKIMTALTALSIPGVNLQEKYKVIKADLVGEASMRLRVNEELTFNDLLHGMLIMSGNDAATAVARYAGAKLPGEGDPLNRFLAKMNALAGEYGMKDTNFKNPHGLDEDGHYSSAFDLAIAGWYLLQNPTLSKIVATSDTVVAGRTLNANNRFLRNYAGATGIKPGQTDNAGLCLVASAKRNGNTVITVILNSSTAAFTADTTAIMDYAFSTLAKPQTIKFNPMDSSYFIGKPNNGKLTQVKPAVQAVVIDDGGMVLQVSNLIYPFFKSNQTAQIQPTFAPTRRPIDEVTPSPTENTNEQTSSTPATQTGGGINLFMLFLLILLILVAVWLAAKYGYIRGDKGRTIADNIQNSIVALFSRIGKLDKTEAKQLPTDESKVGQTYQYKPRSTAEPPSNRVLPRTNPAGSYKPSLRNEAASEVDYIYTESMPEPPRTSRPKPANPPPMPKRANPLDSFFDDEIAPFNFDDTARKLEPESPTTPAMPGFEDKSARPNPAFPNRTAAEPLQQPPTNYDLRPPMPPSTNPLSPSPIRPRIEPEKPITPKPNLPTTPEALIARAQAAIDYAYAGRIQASTDEFRKVIEQDYLFDFGGLDAFEHMPVIGYKALANAYRAAGRPNFAILLLELAIEKFPNELEFRNMLRTFRRDTEI
jgi:D-alanyl-D-alanine carboxypeptidase